MLLPLVLYVLTKLSIHFISYHDYRYSSELQASTAEVYNEVEGESR